MHVESLWLASDSGTPFLGAMLLLFFQGEGWPTLTWFGLSMCVWVCVLCERRSCVCVLCWCGQRSPGLSHLLGVLHSGPLAHRDLACSLFRWVASCEMGLGGGRCGTTEQGVGSSEPSVQEAKGKLFLKGSLFMWM